MCKPYYPFGRCSHPHGARRVRWLIKATPSSGGRLPDRRSMCRARSSLIASPRGAPAYSGLYQTAFPHDAPGMRSTGTPVGSSSPQSVFRERQQAAARRIGVSGRSPEQGGWGDGRRVRLWPQPLTLYPKPPQFQSRFGSAFVTDAFHGLRNRSASGAETLRTEPHGFPVRGGRRFRRWSIDPAP
jgi:hypothetical protein